MRYFKKETSNGYEIYDTRPLSGDKLLCTIHDETEALTLTSHLNNLYTDYKNCLGIKNIVIEKLRPYQELALKYNMPSSDKFAEFVDELTRKIKLLD